jgi:copper chaperone CopZ
MQCKGVIEKEVGKIEGVVSVSADPASKDVVVEFDMPATCANTPG